MSLFGTSEQPIRLLAGLNGAAGNPNKVSVTDDVAQLLATQCVVAVGVSGGKDSDAAAIAVNRHLDQIGHHGPRVLVHADLGRVEWADSLANCERLAACLGWELMVVRRKAGDMLARWEGRWANNVARYRDLSCVKLILPWSTPSMRFCTSELKVDVITSALKKRFPAHNIVNVSGIRRQESAPRRRMPVSAPLAKLQRKGLAGVTWNAIIEWPLEDVLYAIENAGLELHEAYTIYGATRVSCAYCIMSTENDLLAAANCASNRDVYVSMVTLEAASSFAFQGNRWLADVAPHLLPPDLRRRIARSKEIAEQRRHLEDRIPPHLLYTKGWPTTLPTRDEAVLIASIRSRVSDLLQLNADHTTSDAVLNRYGELISLRNTKLAA